MELFRERDKNRAKYLGLLSERALNHRQVLDARAKYLRLREGLLAILRRVVEGIGSSGWKCV